MWGVVWSCGVGGLGFRVLGFGVGFVGFRALATAEKARPYRSLLSLFCVIMLYHNYYEHVFAFSLFRHVASTILWRSVFSLKYGSRHDLDIIEALKL